jgi:diguanylate cyclase (GGDEF)-like protein
MKRMMLYAALSRVFPTSFTAKVFAVAFLGTHVPLLVLAGRALASTGSVAQHMDVLVWTLAATLLGTAATLLALRAILKPLFRVEETMHLFEETGKAAPLPTGYVDEIGRVMARTNRLVLHVTSKVEDSVRSAHEDALTGLLNRRGFEARTREDKAGAVLMIDLDRFKAVNDRFGHATGDAVLCRAAQVIASSVRSDDIVARYGGEEFVAFLPGADRDMALQIAERIRAAIAREVRAQDTPVSASIGVAMTDGLQTLGPALALADESAYAAKAAGRNTVRFRATAMEG